VVIKGDDGDKVRPEIVELASLYGRYGYRAVCAMIRNDGRKINHKWVERIWREEGLKVPKKQPKRRTLPSSITPVANQPRISRNTRRSFTASQFRASPCLNTNVHLPGDSLPRPGLTVPGQAAALSAVILYRYWFGKPNIMRKPSSRNPVDNMTALSYNICMAHVLHEGIFFK